MLKKIKTVILSLWIHTPACISWPHLIKLMFWLNCCLQVMVMMSRSLIILLFCPGFFLSNTNANPTTCLQSQGACYQGAWMKTTKNNMFASFQGIRYAQSPVGELRYRPVFKKPTFHTIFNQRKCLILLIQSWSHCGKDLLIVKKIQPNLIPSKTIPIGCVDLNSKIKFAICHWTWEIGYIWHLQRKSGCFVSTNIW